VATFFLDHNVSYGWRFTLEQAGYVVFTARDRHLANAEDYDILGIAATEGWTVITHNAKDFRLLHGAWLSWHNLWAVSSPRSHAGILIFPHALRPLRAATAVDELLTIESNLANRLFVWHSNEGWSARPSTTAWLP